MMNVYTIFYIFLFYSLYRGLRGVARILSSIHWIVKSRKNLPQPQSDTQKFYILIPVLREQEVIAKTIQRFCAIKGSYQLIFVTTKKEESQKKKQRPELLALLPSLLHETSSNSFLEQTIGYLPQSQAVATFEAIQKITSDEEKKAYILDQFDRKKDTRDLIKEQVEKHSLEAKVGIIEYPNTEGTVPHQLNYACEKIKKECDPHNTFILVYNADSVVSPHLIANVQGTIARYPEANIIQQSTLFLANFSELRGSFLKSIALLQSRWTLAHEMPRIFTQFHSKIGEYFEAAHLVGHGLCIRLSTLEKVGYFPTSFVIEDLPFGYIVRLKGERIYPLPLLENGESPTTVKSMFTQYRMWFHGFFSLPLYTLTALRIQEYSKVKTIIWGVVYLFRNIVWLFTSATWLFLFVMPVILQEPLLLLLSILSFIIYAPLSFFVFNSVINRYGKEVLGDETFSLHIPYLVYITTPITYLTHSFGPMLAVNDLILSTLFRKKIERRKTER
jgi:cellulose synthase/poly-beta-1,6-N-acetylglucosamine synthase-like glycosyltransferase